MATYWITEVDQPDGKPISHVCAGEYNATANTLDTRKKYTRATVLADVKAGGNTWFTATKVTGGHQKGAQVKTTDDGNYVTTKATNTTRDNLGELPPCTC